MADEVGGSLDALSELLAYVMEQERLANVFDRLEGNVRALSAHKCHPPRPSPASSWTCDCGQRWRRELSGGWLTE